jgi:hypothetical protein
LYIDVDASEVLMIGFNGLEAVEAVRVLPVPTPIYYHWHPRLPVISHAHVELLADLEFLNDVDTAAKETLLT